MPKFNQDVYDMRSERELRQKIRELEASTSHITWAEELLERETKVIARAKIWGILYALGHRQEELIRIGFGDDIPPDVYEVISDDPE
jgi:hypothetical protein